MPRRLILPTILAALGLAVLLSLGVWQLQRKTWKEDLIARLEARARTAPQPLDFEKIRNRGREEWEFQLVDVKGRFLHAVEFHVWTPQKQGSAWTVFTPFEIDGPQTRYPRLILVARGIVPDAQKEAATRREGQIEGSLAITGRLRIGEVPALFTPAPDLAKNQWHARDIDTMRDMLANAFVDGSASGRADAARRDILPAYLELTSDAPPGGWPRPTLAAMNLKNDHLGYALTWFGLACTLVGVFAAFARREWRREAE